MTVEYLAADLTAFRPSWIRSDGEKAEFHPSFCLPWFPHEGPLVGAAAAAHRRGTEAGGIPSEVRFDIRNRSRRHWGEGWIILNVNPDSVAKADDQITWHPYDEVHHASVSFSLAVRMALQGVRGSAIMLGMVVPAGLGPGPQEQLLNVMRRDYESVQLFPRPIAIALDWCSSKHAVEILADNDDASGVRVGSLLVISSAADVWEVALVPLRVEVLPEGRMLCPVHDRTQLISEFDVIGLAWQLCKTEEMAEGMLGIMSQPREAMEGAPDPDRYRSAVEMLKDGLPTWPDHPEATTGESRLDDVITASGDVERNGPLLAVLTAGPWTSDLPLPDWLEPRLSGLDVPRVDMGLASPVSGVDEGMSRLAGQQVPYFEALAPVQLHYWGRNRFQDPVNLWQDLLEETEVPAGQEYRSPSPIQGFSLPEGEAPLINLYLQSRRGGSSTLGKLEVRSQGALEDAEAVEIVARVQPGQGLATVDIESKGEGGFRARIREDHILHIDSLPTPVYEWPPGSAYIVSHPVLAIPAARPLRHLADMIDLGRDNPEHYRQATAALNLWQRPGDLGLDQNEIDYPRDEIADMFVYVGAISSGHGPVDPSVVHVLQRLQEILPDRFESADDKIRASMMWMLSWFYARCPQRILAQIPQFFAKGGQLGNAALSVAGNCFHGPDSYRRFHSEFVRAIVHRDPGVATWLRAYRNLTRFRADALEAAVLGEDDQKVILDWYLDKFSTGIRRPGARIGSFFHCVYAAPHFLKRRRYDRTFLDGASKSGKRLAAILKVASERAESTKHRANATCALDFLYKRADFSTLEKLGWADAK